MEYNSAIDVVPLWLILPATFAAVLSALEIGFRAGRRNRRSEEEKTESIGTIVGATLSLPAFLLAFTFGMAASRFDARRQGLLDEVNAIGTAYLRADFLPDSQRTAVREALRNYVETRMLAARPESLDFALQHSVELQRILWSQTVEAVRQTPNSVVVGLFIQSLNEVIDCHTKRITVGIRTRIPGALWYVLAAVTLISMSLTGYHSGLTNMPRRVAFITLSLTFSAVIYLIADIDRPRENTVTTHQQLIIDLKKSLVE